MEVGTLNWSMGGEVSPLYRSMRGEVATLNWSMGGEVATLNWSTGGEVSTLNWSMEGEVSTLNWSMGGEERKEWSVLANIDSAVRNREFWKKDLYLAIQEIREEYKAKADQIKGENATAFEIQIQEISTEVQKYQLEATLAREDLSRQQQELMELRNRLADTESSNLMYEKKFSELQRELEIKVTESQSDRERLYLANEEIQKLLEKLNSQKVVTISLQQEIEEYRFWLKRLEERNIFSFQELIKFQVSESATRTLSKQQRKFARTFKGPVVIDEIGDEGNYITLRNNSTIPRKDVDLNGWKLKRIVESRSIRRESNEYEYVFQKYVLNSGAQLKVYAKSQEALALPGDLVYEGAETWGAGNRATTILYNDSGQERARVEETASFQ
ncbi:60 kDa neurofilament protein [Biomphalaria glabrata]|nr:60 kDa neurofilament protein [Biomphalaria glabrata]